MTCFNREELGILKDLLKRTPDDILQAGLHPTYDQVASEVFVEHQSFAHSSHHGCTYNVSCVDKTQPYRVVIWDSQNGASMILQNCLGPELIKKLA